jgi:hypothetical protein
MSSAGFEPAIPATKRPLTYALDRAASGIDSNFNHRYNVSPIHLHALLGVGNFSKMVRDCRKFEERCHPVFNIVF